MPFQTKIQPMDLGSAARIDPVRPRPSLLRRFFVPRTTITAAPTKADVDRDSDDSGGGGARADVDCTGSLDHMVLSFMEDNTEMNKPLKSRCNCFNSNYDESSDDEIDLLFGDITPVVPTPGDASEIIKGLVPCTNVTERNLLADTSKIMDITRSFKCGKSETRKIICDGLKSLGYDAAVCKSKWEKTTSVPAGEHEYIDVITGGGARLLVEVDFRSEFEIARSTKTYRTLLQSLPSIYVGTTDRLVKIVALVTEAVKQSMRKKGLHFPPWRKCEYMKSKWLSKHERLGIASLDSPGDDIRDISVNFEVCSVEKITVVVRPSEVVIGKPKNKPVAGLTAVL